MQDGVREDCAEPAGGDCLPELREQKGDDSAFGVQRGEWVEQWSRGEVVGWPFGRRELLLRRMRLPLTHPQLFFP
jgi:hypothetical protein